jgi:GH25 family lysozyme M1 (1,4-beta-N-acetylmuramidase)
LYFGEIKPMAITITIPAANSSFALGVPVTFKGKASSGIIKVEIFAEQYHLGGDEVESGDWIITYPAFTKPGLRQIKVVGLDSSGNRVDVAEVKIVLQNSGTSGFEPGIDVSDYDDFVNWQQVRSAGYSFAFAKATEGGTFKASTFPRNWRTIKGTGMIRGAYHFFRPLVDPDIQARNFLDYVASIEPIQPDDLPPALDLEHFPAHIEREWLSIKQQERVERVRAWLAVVERETKRKPMIYTSYGFWSSYMPGVRDFSSYPLWVTNFTTRSKPAIPDEWSSWMIWQHTDSTEIPGIPNPEEDGDRFNGSLSDLLEFVASTVV